MRPVPIDARCLESASHGAQPHVNIVETGLPRIDDSLGYQTTALNAETLAVAGTLGHPDAGSERAGEERSSGSEAGSEGVREARKHLIDFREMVSFDVENGGIAAIAFRGSEHRLQRERQG